MHLTTVFERRDCPALASCPQVTCPGPCDLKTQTCAIVAQACPSTCARVVCDTIPPPSSKGGSSASAGTLAGAIIGALLGLALIILGYLYYRRREAAKEAAAKEKANIDVKPDIPARADAVLSRPDPHFAARSVHAEETEKLSPEAEPSTVRVYRSQSDTTINLDPSRGVQSGAASTRSNPFADGVSIQTASERSQSTNVIPIALVPPGSHQGHSGAPLQAMDVTADQNNNMNLENIPAPDSDLQRLRAPYAESARSGISGKSFMTTSSIATDLDEPPQIMTPKQGVVRQVFGVSQAQVVRVPSNGSASRSRGARGGLNRNASKGTLGRSPLAQQPFTPADIPLTNRELGSPTSTSTVTSRGNPFTDPARSRRNSFADSSRSTDTLGSPNEYHSQGPFTPRPGATFAESPNNHRVSVASTVDGGSIRADIGTASRVILGMQSPGLSAGQSRATSMQTNTGRTIVSLDHDDDGFSVRPHSILSGKTTSSRADSVLAGFPFVPPSPISALPPRSPGTAGASHASVSPSSLGSTFARQQASSIPSSQNPASLSSPIPATATTTTTTTTATATRRDPRGQVPHHMSRTISTSSSGLETYPFQFEDDPATPRPPLPTTSRASLDTIALTRDLAAFPLEYDNSRH